MRGNGSELSGLSTDEKVDAVYAQGAQTQSLVRKRESAMGEVYQQLGKLVAELSRNTEAQQETSTVLRQILPRLATRERQSPANAMPSLRSLAGSHPELTSFDDPAENTGIRLAAQLEDRDRRILELEAEDREQRLLALEAVEKAKAAVAAADELRMKRARAWIAVTLGLAALGATAITIIVWFFTHAQK